MIVQICPTKKKVKFIAAEFEVEDGGELSHFLGMEFEQESDAITISPNSIALDVFGLS